MSNFPELTRDEIFRVLLCGEKPKGGYSIQDYVEEWNDRVKKEGGYEILVPPSNKQSEEIENDC